MPTLNDVAERAGVSTATVSKVLSNTPYVSAATRARVLKAIKETGYYPHLAARALASGKTSIIAVVFPYIYDAIFKDPLVMRILEGIEAVCTEQHYNLLLNTPRLHKGKVDEAYMQLVQSGYVEGLIAIDNVPAMSFAAEAENWGIPTVVLGYHNGDYQVYSDDYQGGQQLLRTVLEHGHTQIGIITTPDEMNQAVARRMQGIHAVFAQSGLPTANLVVVYGEFSSESGAEAAHELLEQNPQLTVIVGLTDRMAIGAMSYLQQNGKQIPTDISVVGYDNIPMAAVSNPPLTTIDQNPVELGQQATELLFKRLNGAEPSTVVLSPALIMRGSLAQR
jgi:DNA-binding LacI/PurR family transcriptional regulator